MSKQTKFERQSINDFFTPLYITQRQRGKSIIPLVWDSLEAAIGQGTGEVVVATYQLVDVKPFELRGVPA